MPDIFLSYNREDQARAKVFAEAFEEQGWSVWWDVGLKTGEAYDEVTEAALRGAKAVVVLWSKKSVVSRWVRAEATLADRNKTLVPCMIEACERPIMFELTQTAELSHWNGDAGDRAWLAFLADVRRFVARDVAAPVAAVLPVVAPPAVEKAARPSLAVLPFTNRSGLKEDDIFAIGMVEDIIDALSMSRGLRVLASGSTAAYRRNSADVAGIAATLGVRYLMEGNIRRVGESLRVTAQLIEAANGAILWTQKFDRPLSELAELQEELVTEVARHLGSQIMRVEIEKALKKPGNITSYEARVRSSIATSRADWPTAIAEAERAVALAPDDGAAHACLAFACSGMIVFGDDEPIWRTRVQTHIARALALDPSRPYVQLWVGWAYGWSGRPAEGLPFMEAAVAANPNASTARHCRGTIYQMVGRLDDAITELNAAIALAPNSVSIYNILTLRAFTQVMAGRLDLALADVDQSLRAMPNFASGLMLRACICGMRDDWPGASAAVRAIRASHPLIGRHQCVSHMARCAWQQGPHLPAMLAARAKAWDEDSSMSAPDIFLSYNREDQARAKVFADAFAARGFDVWWDVGLKTGEAYDEVTEAALRGAKAVVVLWSKKSVVSRWVRAEATLADRNKTLVPCMIEACERPIMFELTQTAELSHWSGDATDRTWAGFVADVRRFIARHGAQAAAQSQAVPSLREIIAEPAKPPETMLAVLPFDNLSADAEMAFFSDGVSEDILGRLSRGSKLKVIGKTSSFQFRGADKPKAAAALKATHVLDGSIRRAGGKVRIAAHLTEIANHTTLWADKYDRSVEDVFAVQDEISEAIAEALNMAFFASKATKIDPETYDLYLRATASKYSMAGMREAIPMLESVTRSAPEFADGWGQLAAIRAQLRWDHPLAERPPMKRAAEVEASRCLALDPDNIYATMAQFQFLDPFGDFLAQEAVMTQLRRIGGASADALFALNYHIECIGRTNEAVEIARRARDLDPMNGWANTAYGQTLWRAGRYAEGRAIMEHTLRLWPDMHYNTATLALCYAHQRDWAALDSLLDPARLSLHPLRELNAIVTLAAAIRDDAPEARQPLLNRMRSRAQRSGHTDTAAAPMVAHYGYVDEAFEILEQSRFGPSGGPGDLLGANAHRTHLLFPHAYPELRNDPRFVKVCARLGLVEFWLATQKWPDCADQVPYDFRAECEKYRSYPKDKFFA